jgi:hypothetical protein
MMAWDVPRAPRLGHGMAGATPASPSPGVVPANLPVDLPAPAPTPDGDRARAELYAHYVNDDDAVAVPDPPRLSDPRPAKDSPAGREETPGAREMTGIGATIAIDRFVGAAKSVQREWPKLSEEQRRDRLTDAANAELRNAGVFPVKPALEDLGPFAGQFHFKSWILGLGKAPFAAPTVTDAQATEIASTVYHESRHAEQFHRMARSLAGEGMKAPEIAEKTEMDRTAAEDAAKKPLTDASSKEAKEAGVWLDSVYRKTALERKSVIELLPVVQKQLLDARAENQRVQADPAAPAWRKNQAYQAFLSAQLIYWKVVERYIALPEERDAYAIERKVKSAAAKK